MIPAIGMTVTEHYCGGRLASVSILQVKSAKCKCDPKKMRKNCCNERTTNFKIKETQNLAKQVDLCYGCQYKFIAPFFPSDNCYFVACVPQNNINIYHPPPISNSGTPKFLFNKILLI